MSILIHNGIIPLLHCGHEVILSGMTAVKEMILCQNAFQSSAIVRLQRSDLAKVSCYHCRGQPRVY